MSELHELAAQLHAIGVTPSMKGPIGDLLKAGAEALVKAAVKEMELGSKLEDEAEVGYERGFRDGYEEGWNSCLNQDKAY